VGIHQGVGVGCCLGVCGCIVGCSMYGLGGTEFGNVLRVGEAPSVLTFSLVVASRCCCVVVDCVAVALLFEGLFAKDDSGGGGGARRGMRLSIFTSSLNYENFVSAQNLSLKVRAFPLLGQRWSSRNTAWVFLVLLRDCQCGSGVCFIYVLYIKDNSWSRKIVINVGVKLMLYII